MIKAVIALAVVVVLASSCAMAPVGTPGPAADALADRIESAVNLRAWNELGVVSWSFRGSHHWLWDRFRSVVRLTDDDGAVFIDTWDHSGLVFDARGNAVVGRAADERVRKAWANFVNDSFWLNPFASLRSPGARRELVELDGATALLIRFDSGGVTPGDSYAFFVDEGGLPRCFRLWVQALPLEDQPACCSATRRAGSEWRPFNQRSIRRILNVHVDRQGACRRHHGHPVHCPDLHRVAAALGDP